MKEELLKRANELISKNEKFLSNHNGGQSDAKPVRHEEANLWFAQADKYLRENLSLQPEKYSEWKELVNSLGDMLQSSIKRNENVLNAYIDHMYKCTAFVSEYGTDKEDSKTPPDKPKKKPSRLVTYSSIACIVACIFAILTFYFQFIKKDRANPAVREPTPSVNVKPKNIPPNDDKKVNGKTVKVTFSDGTVADIGVSILYRVEPQNAPIVVAKVGTPEKGMEILDEIVRSNLLAIMEKHTIKDAKLKRKLFEKQILKAAREKGDELGISISDILLQEIALKRNTNNQKIEKVRLQSNSSRELFDSDLILTLINTVEYVNQPITFTANQHGEASKQFENIELGQKVQYLGFEILFFDLSRNINTYDVWLMVERSKSSE